jgi:ATP-dependent Clp protease ATP-binding subunit ClpA
MIKTWQQRCEEHPDHDGIVSEGMIRQRMQEEIDELRQALAEPANSTTDFVEPKALAQKEQKMRIEGSGKLTTKPYPDRYESEQEFRRALAEPKREWIGLSDEEIKEIIGPWGDTPVKGYTRKLFDQIEAKLKEKNHG